MYSLEIYGRVRRAVFVDGKNQRTVAKEYGFARETVRKMLRYSAPAGLPAGTSGEAAQAAGEAWVVIVGVEQKAHYFAMDLPQSDDSFVAAYPAETTEAFLDAHVRVFDYFGGVPRLILYDNTRIAVARIPDNGEHRKTRAFCELQGHWRAARTFCCWETVARARRTSRWLSVWPPVSGVVAYASPPLPAWCMTAPTLLSK
jgi:hypothetical protein